MSADSIFRLAANSTREDIPLAPSGACIARYQVKAGGSLLDSCRRIASRAVEPAPQMRWFRKGLCSALNLTNESKFMVECRNEPERYFDAVESGNGIWKWRHYFNIYDRHLRKFKGKEVKVLEFGIYSGGR